MWINDLNQEWTAFWNLLGSQSQVQNSGMWIPVRQTTFFSRKAVNSELSSPVLVFLSTEFRLRTRFHPFAFQQTPHGDRRNCSLLNCADYIKSFIYQADCRIKLFWKNVKTYVKIYVKSAPTCFGLKTIIRDLTVCTLLKLQLLVLNWSVKIHRYGTISIVWLHIYATTL
jgi:hypothetical protein